MLRNTKIWLEIFWSTIESKLKKCSFLVEKRKLPFEINVLSYALVDIEPLDGYPICKNIKEVADYVISNEKNIDNNSHIDYIDYLDILDNKFSNKISLL